MIYQPFKYAKPRNDKADDNPIDWDCLDEFEEAQHLCDYREYDEDYIGNEYV